jgi:hypothetical protein
VGAVNAAICTAQAGVSSAMTGCGQPKVASTRTIEAALTKYLMSSSVTVTLRKRSGLPQHRTLLARHRLPLE